MKIFITGGAGFIGSHLTDTLLARGDEVFVIDNYSTGKKENLQEHKNLTVVEGTIVDTALVDRIMGDFRPDVVVHAAASYKNPDDWEEDSRTNVTGSAIIAQASVQYGVKRLVYYNTALCYGLHPEEQPISITHSLRPYESSYAITKTAGETYIALSGIEFISLRLANAYGPRNLSGPLPTFYHRISRKKGCFVVHTRRDFIYVQDLVDITVKAIDGAGTKGYYHVSSGTDYSIKELYEGAVSALRKLNVEEAVPVEERERNPDDAYSILLDPSKTNDDFDWKVTTPLEEGIDKAINWYSKHDVEQTYTHLKLED